MTVIGVLTHANVSDDEHLRSLLADDADGILHHAVLVPCRRTDLILRCRKTEQQNAGNTKLQQLVDLGHKKIKRHLENTRHAGNLVMMARAGLHEQRIDEVLRGKLGLANELANRLVLAHATRTIRRELAILHECLLLGSLPSCSSLPLRKSEAPVGTEASNEQPSARRLQ